MRIGIIIAFLLFSPLVLADNMSLDLLQMTQDGDTQKYSVKIQILALMTMLTVLPALVLMMTSFTRIVIVLSILRQALGMPQTPSNQILIGVSLFLTFFIMAPIFNGIYSDAVVPYTEEKLDQQQALDKAGEYLRHFMYNQIRSNDLNLFLSMSSSSDIDADNKDSIPMSVLVPAFVTSELKTAFQIGFVIFIPFLIIDLVVASVLMSMGMMMLSPLIISLPFKIMLFVLVDGWNLLLGTLATSFGVGV